MSEKKSWLGEVLAAAQSEVEKLPPWMRRSDSVGVVEQRPRSEKEAESKKKQVQKEPEQK